MLQGYHIIQFEGKEIQVKWDAKPKKYWFVVEDVLSYLFDNPKFYWQKIKEKIGIDSCYYITCTYGNQKVDIGDYHQISSILYSIPGNIKKIEKLIEWVHYPMPSAIQQEIINFAYYNHEKSEWDKIIERANSCNIPTETATQYLNALLDFIKRKEEEQKKIEEEQQKSKEPQPTETPKTEEDNNQNIEETQKEETLEERKQKIKEQNTKIANIGCSIMALIAVVLITIFIIKVGMPAVILTLTCFAMVLFMSFIHDYDPLSDSENNKYREPIQPSPLSIITTYINSILQERMILKDEKEYIVCKGVEYGIKASVLNNLIKTKIREKLKSHDNLINCSNCNEKIPEDTNECPFCNVNVGWQNIEKLTALALSDGVITDLERGIIEYKASLLGVSSTQIKHYLEAQLEMRLKSYTKVDLRDCPFCGAQIPLVSDECLYCGKSLEHIEDSLVMPTEIEGREASIIRSENMRMDTQRHNIKNCPDCGTPFPLLSNICPSCGHVLHELNDSPLNINNLLTKISKSIYKIDHAPQPKVHQILGYWIYYIILIISILSFISGIVLHSELGKLISLIGFGIGLVSIIFGTSKTVRDSKTPSQVADKEYYKARHTYEMYVRQVASLYGDSREAKPLLTKFADSIKQIQKVRYHNRITVTSIIGIIAISIIGILSYFNSQKEFDKYINEPSIYDSTWTMPSNAQSVLSISKRLKPYPSENGVEERLNGMLCANKGADLTFVLNNDNVSYRWKINKLELLPSDSCGIKKELINRTITIHLLDSNYRQISTLAECIVSTHDNCNYHTVMDKGNGHYFVDFWSKYPTNTEDVIDFITERATYYTIYASNQ
ncbi:MAG: zinc ribbon domain-containing protein [Alphaproteobacteria bacterium]|nr:zinc ribbon domain-containing protein [Alphaproteobacteria bacterium]